MIINKTVILRIFFLYSIIVSANSSNRFPRQSNPESYKIVYNEVGAAIVCTDVKNCSFVFGPNPDLLKRAFAFSNKHWKCHDLRCRRHVPKSCSYIGEDECAQMLFQCAEFVSRSLAAAGLLPNIDPYRSRVRDLVRYRLNGVEYNIGFASRKYGMLGLKEFLEDQPWKWEKFTCTPFVPTEEETFTHEENRDRTLSSGECSADNIRPGSVLIMKNGRHSGIAVDFNKVNTHNPARFQRPFDEFTHFPINYIFSPIFI